MPPAARPRTVRDVTTGRMLVTSLEVASNPWTRFRGLMLRRALPPGGGLLIAHCTSIHMMWMRFRIDAVWVSRDDVVTHVSCNVPTWIGLARGRRGTHAVIELPAGAAEGVEPGHRLEFA